MKVTGYIVQKIIFRTKIFYEDRKTSSRRVKGGAIIVCNHTSVYDFAALLFVFFGRTLRCQMAEVLFKKRLLGLFLRAMGGVKVDRNANDYAFMDKCERILAKKGVVLVFPEGRLPKEGEERPLPFGPGAAYLAFRSGAPVIPVYTDGNYFGKGRARVVIGRRVYAADVCGGAGEAEDLEKFSSYLRGEIIALGESMNG